LRLPELAGEGQEEARAGRAERVAERDRAAVDVDLVAVEVERLLDAEVLPRERLVDLEQVDVLDLHAGALARRLDRGDRPDAHDLGRHTGDRPRDDARDRRDPELLRALRGRHDERRRAVDDAGRVAGGDGPALAE